MSFRPSRQQLRAFPYEVAECFGKPHIGAYYSGSSAKSHKAAPDARCAICGRRVDNVHHCPPLSKGHQFPLVTPEGTFKLRPSLFALCGSGTTGCHNGFHGGARFKAEWIWHSDKFAEKWWNGWFLSHGLYPHSSRLYEFGHWVIYDRELGLCIEVRK